MATTIQGEARMSTTVKQGYDLTKNFTALEVYPDEDFAGGEIVDLVETYGCSYVTLLPFPANEDSSRGGLVLFASPYPLTVDEARDLFEQWSAATDGTQD
jgi:hypothetical protein